MKTEILKSLEGQTQSSIIGMKDWDVLKYMLFIANI